MPKKDSHNIKTVCSKKIGLGVIAIVKAKHWFQDLFELNKVPYFIQKDDYVVCRWNDYHDGEKSNPEGLTTISICKIKEDAEILFNAHIRLTEFKFNKF